MTCFWCQMHGYSQNAVTVFEMSLCTEHASRMQKMVTAGLITNLSHWYRMAAKEIISFGKLPSEYRLADYVENLIDVELMKFEFEEGTHDRRGSKTATHQG